MKAPKAAIATLVLAGWSAALAQEAPANPTLVTASERFLMFYRREDRSAGKVTDEILQECRQWLEHAYEVEVDKHGFKPPWGRRVAGRIPVQLSYFSGKNRNSHGMARRSDGSMYLNLRSWDRRGRNKYNRDKRLMPVTVCHELFHIIQYAYDRKEPSWLLEATARAAETLVYPDVHYSVRQERQFLGSMEYPLNWPLRRHELAMGRPYGASAFFRFLMLHHPQKQDILRAVWERCEAVKGDNAFEAVVHTIDPADPNTFREYFERFAIGASMGKSAQAPCKLADADLVGEIGNTYLSVGWANFYARVFGVDNPWYTLGPDVAGFAHRPEDCWVGGPGARCFVVMPLRAVPPRTELFFGVAAPKDDVIVRGLADYGKGWRIFPATYDAGAGAHVVWIPALEEVKGWPQVLVIRPAEYHRKTPHNIQIAAANPPVLQEAAVRQGGRTVLHRRWEDRLRADGLIERRARRTLVSEDLKTAEAELTLVFSQPVRPKKDRPLAALDGKAPLTLNSSDGGKTWTGTIPRDALAGGIGRSNLLVNAEALQAGARAVMPLDERPETAARLHFAKWAGYERSGTGTKVPLRVASDVQFKVSLYQRYRRGPVVGKIWLLPPGRTSLIGAGEPWPQPYLIVARLGRHVRYIYPTYVEEYAKGGQIPIPFDQFELPGGLKPLPAELKLTAVFADGRRIEQVRPLEYKGEQPVGAERTQQMLRKYRARFLEALNMPAADSPQARRRMRALRDAAQDLLERTTDSREAEVVWEQVRRFGWSDSAKYSLHICRFRGSLMRYDAKACMESLSSLRRIEDVPDLMWYRPCMKLLVATKNDTAGARQVWQWYKTDGAKLSPQQRERYGYDRNVASRLGIPAKPIRP